jgi:hypothetical protein
MAASELSRAEKRKVPAGTPRATPQERSLAQEVFGDGQSEFVVQEL